MVCITTTLTHRVSHHLDPSVRRAAGPPVVRHRTMPPISRDWHGDRIVFHNTPDGGSFTTIIFLITDPDLSMSISCVPPIHVGPSLARASETNARDGW